ncbi:MAG TPA: carotenoid oxygenase family protein, partial [Rhizomicrobium sp.]
GSHIGVMRRDAGVESIRWFTTDACYVFHPMNMWDDGDRLHADVMEYEAAPLFPNADGSRGRETRAHLVRWTFDLVGTSNTIVRTQLDDIPGEFPRFDERRAGLPYRHGWFAGRVRGEETMVFDSIVHLDLQTGSREVYAFPPGDVPAEPVFIPRGTDEGDGWLATIVYRAQENRSDFVLLDAQNIAKGPVGCAQLPRRVPFGFHGNWVPA